MKEYFLILIGVSLICGFSSMLSPEGRGGGLSRAVNLASSLCVLSVVISPVHSLILEASSGEVEILSQMKAEYGDVDVLEDIYCDKLTEESVSYAERTLEELLCRNFSISSDSISLLLEVERAGESVRVCGARVYLSGGAIFKDADAISKYVESSVGCECKIIYSREKT